MTTGFSRQLGASLLLLGLAVPLPARAEPNAADIETARGLYVEGLQLRDAGRLDVSLARFKAAHSLAATPITSLELGRAYALVADLVAARDVLQSVERMPVLATESTKAASARLEARALAEQIRERMPALRIAFSREPASPPHVTIDGQPIVPESLGTPRKVNPGSHVVIAETTDGARANASVVLAEREVRTLTLTLGPGGHPEVPPETKGDAKGERGPLTPWFYVGLGTAGVGVLTGTITGIVALAKADSLESQCTGTQCPRYAEGDLSTSRTMGTVSTIAVVVAGAGVAVALVSWFTRPAAATPVRAAPNALRWSW
ncbi:MAG TPA: hypothetical protein VLT33_13270 [Labilithrix sp.]|nr:hypothetical protein [Labilithrix sp.]